MKLHEFQSKQILSRYGLAAPRGGVAITPEQARQVAGELGQANVVVKAQVHAGGRGRAGGILAAASPAEAEKAARALLGKLLVTEQTGKSGLMVKRVLVEAATPAPRSIHLSMLVDPAADGILLACGATGGVDIEERVRAGQTRLEQLCFVVGQPTPTDRVVEMSRKIGLAGAHAAAFVTLVEGLLGAFHDLDASLIEINPLAVMDDGTLLALDAKMIIDDNALFRQHEMAALREDNELEMTAQQRHINYVHMDGDIGIAANGAGLGLATFDMVVEAQGRPANFMDIRTTATSLDIAHGFKLILDNPKVRALLVNVHGGGMQPCDTVAEGLAIAMRRTGRAVPTVVRLAGNNARYARSRFDNFGCRIIDCPDMWTAAKQAVAAAL